MTIFCKRDLKPFVLHRPIAPLSFVSKILSIGWPMSFQYGIEVAAFVTMTYFMGLIGNIELAAQQILLQCSMMVILCVAGLSQASTVLIGKTLRPKKYKSIEILYSCYTHPWRKFQSIGRIHLYYFFSYLSKHFYQKYICHDSFDTIAR